MSDSDMGRMCLDERESVWRLAGGIHPGNLIMNCPMIPDFSKETEALYLSLVPEDWYNFRSVVRMLFALERSR
jgi:hypothetical protein